MGKLSEIRRRQIVSHAQPYLEDDDDVRHWARARKPGSRQEGFAYLTDRRFVVHWRGRDDGHESVEWSEIRSWRVRPEERGGPLLEVQAVDREFSVQIAVRTKQMAAAAAGFLREFEQRTPAPGSGRADTGVFQVALTPRSVRDQTMRILVTVLGGLLVFVGLIITPLPGPWSFPIVLAGLAILASEYDWAKDAQDWIKSKLQQARQRLRARREPD
ncbi:MAG TPA: PGPGW domain-containing protein [Actinomycetota bacterium]|nr:PGPGW domain-containing protein [Actinomycetota bacterium]